MLRLKLEARLEGFTIRANIAAGNEILVLSGPSGCGKTMLLRMIAGLKQPHDGFVRLNGRTLFSTIDRIDIPARQREVGLVFQDYALFPHMTVERNVLYGVGEDAGRGDIPARASAMLEVMKIAHLKDRFPKKLSGGEKQRVALARALISEPQLLLLDEPLSALDSETRAELQSELKAIQRERSIPFILVTHDTQEAERLGDSTAEFSMQPGLHTFTRLRCRSAPSVARPCPHPR